MTPPHFNTYQSSYNNTQFQQQQQFSTSQSPQYGSNYPTHHYSTTYPNAYSSTVHQEAFSQPPYVPQIEYIVSIINQQTHLVEFPQTDFGLAVPGRQNSYAAGTSGTRANTSGTGGNYSGQQRVVKYFNCQGQGHMARQCPKLKRKRDATWFREKVLLVEAQGNGKVLNEEELEFLADPSIAKAEAVLMANLSSYRSDVLSEVPISDNTNNDMLHQSVQEMPYSKPSHFVEHPENEIHSDSNIILYS
ncbi:retrovirus-related pol polyprotein from transposon TNT 1-94 [Tanacetum coccineum]